MEKRLDPRQDCGMKINVMSKSLFILLILVLFLFAPGFGQEKEPAPPNRPFRIGFLRTDEEQTLVPAWYESLKRFLLEQPSVASALEKYRFTSIILLQADGYRDMLQRMDLNEFDLAFCSSVIFVEQHGDYLPILQLRADIFDSRGQGMTLHKGIIIIGRHSPLFPSENSSPDKIGEYIRSHSMAFVSPHNAVGYVYPRLSLWRSYGVREPGEFIFCGSSEEVVKYVISGLVGVGACDRASLDTVLNTYCPDIPAENMVQILCETAPAPTDPVVIRSSLHPQKSEFGRVLKGALKIFYNNTNRFGIPRVADSRDENFKNLREEIADFHSLSEVSSTEKSKEPMPKDK